ncbi:TetR/AcrR family transcriptional regulator [Haloactinomyces albus]|uniref:AcrR family transcriptional regulator n=1 Tax=Haloactinomyces albus TaxID=1352928 RepID=A0AAE3ZB68_9ACTN|nr:TetR/AcrR family transcriptional regulator [Haloactinomyces albus]MDR7300665.1 AcrR family transcriptional regulator [Haloactinomyces albus]
MPKRVDHEKRRQKIAEAVWRIAADRGLEAASLREVGTEAGVSMGRIQHYFASKDRMILFACEYMVELAEQGARELSTASADPEAPRSIIRGALARTLPLDEQQRIGTGVWFAFLTRATGDHDLAAFIRRAWAGTLDLVAGQIRRGQENGDIPAGVDPKQEAVALVALTDGLVSHLMVGHYTGEEALSAVDNHLDRLFG